MPIYNIVTKKWTFDVEEQSRHGIDEDGNDLIYMDDEENNFGKPYEYSYESGEETEEEEAVDDTSTQHSDRQAELKKKLLSLLK